MKAPSKALVETTILTNALLKPTEEGRVARAAIANIPETLLPQYAIKEFKAGPLRGYVWFHNKVVSSSAWGDAVRAIPLIWRQHNKMATALKALTDFESSISKRMPPDLAKQYPNQTVGMILRAEGIIWLKTAIFRAWRKRRQLTTRVVAPLSCYPETDPELKTNGRIDDTPVVCGVDDCCLRPMFIKNLADIDKLISACDMCPPKAETQKRQKTLKHLRRLPDRNLSEAGCRSLGDAVFAIQCPKDAVVLTTNIADHQPLADAMGVSAVDPDAV
jgi:hypothetical protein